MNSSVLITCIFALVASSAHAQHMSHRRESERTNSSAKKRPKDCRDEISEADQKLMRALLEESMNLSKQDLPNKDRQNLAWKAATSFEKKIAPASRVGILTDIFLRRFDAYPKIAAAQIATDCKRFEEWLQSDPERLSFDIADFMLHNAAPYLSWDAPRDATEIANEEAFVRDFDRLQSLDEDSKITFQKAVKELRKQKHGSVKGAVFPHRNPYGLNRSEWLSLLSYTGGDYAAINKDLRHNKGAAYPAYTRTLNTALSKLPQFEGTVYRGAKFPPEVRALHREGMIYEAQAFTSTSASRDTAAYFGTEDFAVIRSKSGRIVNNYGALAGAESEILFQSGTRFRVNRIEVDGNNRTYFMEEL